jgi:hypothetical protein
MICPYHKGAMAMLGYINRRAKIAMQPNQAVAPLSGVPDVAACMQQGIDIMQETRSVQSI